MSGEEIKRCERCDAQLGEGDKRCPNCNKLISEQVEGLAAVPEKPVNCPVCKIPAYKASLSGREIIHCAECGGAALRKELIMKLRPNEAVKLAIGPEERDYRRPPFFEKRDKPPFLICPYCMKKMEEKKFGEMSVDMCEKCGALWLDGGKLNHIGKILAPYKMRAVSGGGGGGRRRR
ncbi:MAG TPA: hypothetical protein ENN43_01755 [bacterium]|nr:hypothetical protein [bacterium]